MAIAPSINQAADDVGPQTGTVYFGDYTNDTAPVLSVSLGDQAVAGDTLVVRESGSALTSITLSAQDVAAGRVDVQLSGLSSGWHPLRVALTANGADKIVSTSDWAIGVETQAPATPVISGASDNFGAVTGQVTDGGHTDDATLTFTLHEDGLPPMPTGSPGHAPYGGAAIMSGHIDLYDGSTVVGRAMVGYGGEVQITPTGLSEGDHVLTAVAVDRAGNVSGASAPFHVTVGADQTTTTTTTTASSGGGGASGGSGSAIAGQSLTANDAGGTLQGGAGDDTIKGGAGQDYLRGGEGSDQINGGDAFDDLNGNQGDDTLSGGLGGDWVVGGRDDDRLSGDEGNDVVYGNIGADWADGGAGDDIVRGGQDDDVVLGGAGNDWLSGDKGSDTVTGGSGADVFHTWADAGIDRVTDFNLAEGDRVMVDAGTTYAFAQVGADTVITMGDAQMVLVGVQATTLTTGWIFAG